MSSSKAIFILQMSEDVANTLTWFPGLCKDQRAGRHAQNLLSRGDMQDPNLSKEKSESPILVILFFFNSIFLFCVKLTN